MMLTEVHMLSGYFPEETDQELLQRLQRRGISRVEIKDKSVIFYMDEVSKMCFLLHTKYYFWTSGHTDIIHVHQRLFMGNMEGKA